MKEVVNMLQEDINIVLNKMSSVLDNRQMIKLNRVLEDLLHAMPI